ncbi:MAG: hypothetical protein ACQEP8_00550 [Chlamydiota bacterium]
MPKCLFLLLAFIGLYLPGESANNDSNINCWAVVVVPVADVLDEPPPYGGAPERYLDLPYNWVYSPSYDRPRFHQLLFNQLVKIVAEENHEYKVEITNLYYQTLESREAHTFEGWILSEGVVKLNHLIKKKLDLKRLPCNLPGQGEQDIISLTSPYYSAAQEKLYSAGTRFVLAKEKADSFIVYGLQPESLDYQTLKVPKSLALRNKTASIDQKIQTYISLIQEWSTLEEGIIPYLQGGASWTKSHYNREAVKRPLFDTNGQPVYENGNKRYGYYRLEDFGDPRTGLDCSSIIWLAAQTVNIPYYCKNSSTLYHQLKPLQVGDSLAAGDILWFPGHVMIISQLNPLMLIQSEGYGARLQTGYVAEHAAESLFQGINTLSELQNAYHSQASLKLKGSRGEVAKEVTDWRLIKFRSCWDIADQAMGILPALSCG